MPIKKRITSRLRKCHYKRLSDFSAHWHEGDLYRSKYGYAIVQSMNTGMDRTKISITFKEQMQDLYPLAIIIFNVLNIPDGISDIEVQSVDYSEHGDFYDILNYLSNLYEEAASI